MRRSTLALALLLLACAGVPSPPPGASVADSGADAIVDSNDPETAPSDAMGDTSTPIDAAPDAPPLDATTTDEPAVVPDAPDIGADALSDAATEAGEDAATDTDAGCAPGFFDCNGDTADGCEVDTRTDPMHCGACRARCVLDHVTSAACDMGSCRVAVCAPAFGDCDRNPLNGCEVNIRESLADCGGCGMRCESLNRGTTCSSGVCVRGSCIVPFLDCDGDPSNGCEADPRTSTLYCGRCGNPCQATNAVPACIGGVCRIDRCMTGYADCDGSATNGCEVDARSDPRNCGACGVRCDAGQLCGAGGCSNVVCSALETRCGTACVNAQTDRNNCGACGRRCPSPAGATVACVAGACVVTACAAAADGEVDCDRDPSNGCEANLNNSSNCGACGVACGAGRWCAPGRVCACVSPTVNCGGRCVRLADPANCGRCDNACSDREICAGSPMLSCNSCGEDSPSTMRRRCDNTCVDLLNDIHNCGACGMACSMPRVCRRGECQ